MCANCSTVYDIHPDNDEVENMFKHSEYGRGRESFNQNRIDDVCVKLGH